MAENIRVLIVDDLPETRENVRKLLQFESDIEVIGQAGTGEEAIEMARQYSPDIILMDINMPGVDGIGASQQITELVPTVQIIIMSVQSDPNYLRRAMMAGARDFLTKPFGGDELVAAIRRVHDKRPAVQMPPAMSRQAYSDGRGAELPPERDGKVIAVFSPKGGTGCTTIAINLAVSLAKRGHSTALVDASLQFGDVSVMLNLRTMTSLADLGGNEEIDSDLISSVVQVHRSDLNVLLAPPRPEMADVVTDEVLKNLVINLRHSYDFIIVDTPSVLDEKALAVLDEADRIILVTQQSLTSLKNVSRFFDLTESLDYAPQKVWLVVNRASNKSNISVKDVGDTLKRSIFMVIPRDDVAVDAAADKGVPLVTGVHQKRPVSQALLKLAAYVLREMTAAEAAANGKEKAEKAKQSGLLGRLFSRSSAGG